MSTAFHPPCTGAPDLYFSEHPADLRVAQELCSTCPFARSCLDGALQRAEPWGVWGGEILVAGQVVARKRGRGRPRKEKLTA